MRPQAWEQVSPRKLLGLEEVAGGVLTVVETAEDVSVWPCQLAQASWQVHQPVAWNSRTAVPQACRLVPSGAGGRVCARPLPSRGSGNQGRTPLSLLHHVAFSLCVCVLASLWSGPTPGTSLSPAHLHRPCLGRGTFTGTDGVRTPVTASKQSAAWRPSSCPGRGVPPGLSLLRSPVPQPRCWPLAPLQPQRSVQLPCPLGEPTSFREVPTDAFRVHFLPRQPLCPHLPEPGLPPSLPLALGSGLLSLARLEHLCPVPASTACPGAPPGGPGPAVHPRTRVTRPASQAQSFLPPPPPSPPKPPRVSEEQ